MTTVIVPAIIAAAYLESKTDSDNVVAASAIRYCDEVYQELVDEKKLINEDFVKKTSKINSLVYRNKYALPTDFEKMNQISIKYSVPTYTAWTTWVAYVIGDKVTDSGKAYICNVDHTAWATFAGDITKREQLYEWYIPVSPRMNDFEFQRDFNEISESTPVYFYENNDLYIYPWPTEAVVEWILFDYIPVETTLTTTTDDATIKIEKKLEKRWIKWVAAKFAWHVEKNDVQAKLSMEYITWKQECRDRWKSRHYAPVVEELPSSLLRYMR